MDAVLGYSELLHLTMMVHRDQCTDLPGMFYGITKTLGGGSTKSMTYLRDIVDASSQYKVRTTSILPGTPAVESIWSPLSLWEIADLR